MAIQRENVMQRLVRLREEIGHPDKAGEPLPQDQAAAKAGVTARQWQRWESGESVPYARNLSAVADAFEFDVGEFYDGPAGQQPAPTPTPFADTAEDRLERMEARLDEHARKVEELLARQSQILDRIEAAIKVEDDAATRLATAEDQWVQRTLQKALTALSEHEDEPGTQVRGQRKSAKSASR